MSDPEHGPTRRFLESQLDEALTQQSLDQSFLADAQSDADTSDRRVSLIASALLELDHLEGAARREAES